MQLKLKQYFVSVFFFLFFVCFFSSVDPPGNQTCHQKPDYQRTAGPAWMQLALYCGLLWRLLQWWRDQHLYGAHGERQRLLAAISLWDWNRFCESHHLRILMLCNTHVPTATGSFVCLNMGCFGLCRMADPWTRFLKKPEESQKKSLEKLA